MSVGKNLIRRGVKIRSGRVGKNRKINKRGDPFIWHTRVQAGGTAIVSILDSKNERKPEIKDKLRDTGKLGWAGVYRNWSEEDFRAKMRINRATLILFLMGPMRI